MKKTNGLTFVEERAVEVLLLGNTAYQEGTHLFAKHHARLASAPQQNTLPNGMEKGTPDHVLYLFLTTLVTLQSDSDEGFLSAKGLWDQHPECFTCDAVLLAERQPQEPQQRFAFYPHESVGEKTSPKNELARLFKYYGFNKPNPWSRYWADTVRTLFDEYGGDPLAIIDDVKTVNGFLAKKRKANREGKPWWCNGMGPKLFSLFCIFCEELGLIEPVPDAFPADVHVQRIALGTGIIAPSKPRIPDLSIAEQLRINLSAFSMEHFGSAVDLSHVLWLAGSKGCRVCAHTPDIEQQCPFAQYCAGSPNTMSYWRRGRWELDGPWNAKGLQDTGLFS